MKLNKWLLGAVALAMMASCSDNVSDGPNQGEGGGESSSGVSYLGISIELPSEATTRAEDEDHMDNDFFEDGLPKEYAVDHAAILLFQGPNEAGAKFVGAYKLGTDKAFDQPDKDQITVSFQKTIKVLNKPVLENANDKLWGLAILNYSEDIFVLDLSTESQGYGSLSVVATDATHNLGRYYDNKETATTFESFRGYITNSKFIRTGDYIFMTNAPLSNAGGTTAQPSSPVIQTLTPLQDNFKKSETEAIQSPAGCIFVERAVAKITVSQFPSSVTLPHTSVTISDNGTPNYVTSDYTLNIESVEWLIDNEEQTSYIVRNAQTSSPFWDYGYNGKYRFIGNTSMANTAIWPDPEGNHNKFRTYWCVDPAYSTDKVFNDQANVGTPKYSALNLSNNNYSSTTALYPRENTFDVAHQQYKNTTRAVFKVKYSGPTEDFQLYALKSQLSTFYLVSDARNLLKRSVLGSTRLHDLILKYKKPTIESLPYSENDFIFNFDNADNDPEGNNLVDPQKGIEAGDYVITNITFNNNFITNNFVALDDAARTDIATELAGIATSANQDNHIVEFKDNTCYYTVYIKHFGDTYCPLPDEWTGDQVGVVYKGSTTTYDSQRYLGRYGLVRNNWYDLSVSLIKRLGNAAVPNGNVPTSDDNKTDEWYLSARIHILSWARRTQNVTFQ